jgi:hypothetical protein
MKFNQIILYFIVFFIVISGSFAFFNGFIHYLDEDVNYISSKNVENDRTNNVNNRINNVNNNENRALMDINKGFYSHIKNDLIKVNLKLPFDMERIITNSSNFSLNFDSTYLLPRIAHGGCMISPKPWGFIFPELSIMPEFITIMEREHNNGLWIFDVIRGFFGLNEGVVIDTISISGEIDMSPKFFYHYVNIIMFYNGSSTGNNIIIYNSNSDIGFFLENETDYYPNFYFQSNNTNNSSDINNSLNNSYNLSHGDLDNNSLGDSYNLSQGDLDNNSLDNDYNLSQ